MRSVQSCLRSGCGKEKVFAGPWMADYRPRRDNRCHAMAEAYRLAKNELAIGKTGQEKLTKKATNGGKTSLVCHLSINRGQVRISLANRNNNDHRYPVKLGSLITIYHARIPQDACGLVCH